MSKKNIAIVITIVLQFLIITSFGFYTNFLKDKVVISNQNEEAARAQIETYKDKEGRVSIEVASFNKTIEQLEVHNADLAAELEAERGKEPEVIIRTEFVVQRDTIRVETEDIVIFEEDDTSHVALVFKHVDTSLTLNSVVNFSLSEDSIFNAIQTIDSFEVGIDIITGVKTEDGISKIFVKSNNENVIFSNIEGNILPEREATFRDKFGIGVAVGPTVNYDFIDSGWSVGIGVTAGFLWKGTR